jgi:hypothetical protein
MKIEKLHLENIGVFDSLDLAFPRCGQPGNKADIHIFTGTNGSKYLITQYHLRPLNG